MGKKPNYKAKFLLDVVDLVLPIGRQEVSQRYKAESGDADLRDWQDLKRYFVEKLCDKNRKPTGESAPKPQVARAQAIHEKMLRKEGAAVNGDEISSEDGNDDEDEEDDEDAEESPPRVVEGEATSAEKMSGGRKILCKVEQ